MLTLTGGAALLCIISNHFVVFRLFMHIGYYVRHYQEESPDNSSVENSSDESDSSSDKEMDEDRNIELTTLSPAGTTTPAQADFSPIPIGDTPWSWEQPEPPLNDIQTKTYYTTC